MVAEGEVGSSGSSQSFWASRSLTQYNTMYLILYSAGVYLWCFVDPEERVATLSWLREVQEVLWGIAHRLRGSWRMKGIHQGTKAGRICSHSSNGHTHLCVLSTLLATGTQWGIGPKGSVLKELIVQQERDFIIERGNTLFKNYSLQKN